MKTFKQFINHIQEQIPHVEPSDYTKEYQKSNMIAKRQQITHAHRELKDRADREQREKLKRLKAIETGTL
jgi:hypothetical protein